MSLLHSATPHRTDGPDDRTALPHRVQIPVVLPLVEVTVDDEGRLDVLVDHEPYSPGSPDGVLRREDLRRVIASIAADLGTPVRVEVREADGTTFADLVTPDRQERELTPPPAEQTAASAHGAGEVVGGGFLPCEEVAVAVVVAHLAADDDGTARLRLPPALATHPGLIVLMGERSGSVILSGSTDGSTIAGAG